MDELGVIQSSGIMTAPEIAIKLNKSRNASSRCLRFYLTIKEIKNVEIILRPKGRTILYLENGLYKDLFEDKA